MKFHELRTATATVLRVTVCYSIALNAAYGQGFVPAPLPGAPQNANPVSATIPTDVTGVGGDLGAAQGLRHRLLGGDRNTVPNSHGVIVSRDPRYDFTGKWYPINSAQVAFLQPSPLMTSSVLPTPPALGPELASQPLVPTPWKESVSEASLPATAQTGGLGTPTLLTQPAVVAGGAVGTVRAALDSALRVPAFDLGTIPSPRIPEFMPATGAQFSTNGVDQFALSAGAVMIKAGAQPLTLTACLKNERATVLIRKGAIAVISLLDDHLTVANLHDSGRDSVRVALSDRAAGDSGFDPVRIGQMVEAYPNFTAPENELVAYTVLSRLPLTNGYTAETTRFSYPLLMKKFNVTRSLAPNELRQIVKSAAAVSYSDREREWNGITPYAP